MNKKVPRIMRLIRFHVPGKGIRMGLLESDNVYDLTAINATLFRSFQSMLEHSYSVRLNIEEVIRRELQEYGEEPPSLSYLEIEKNPPSPLNIFLEIPHDPPEVWGCGVTYLQSRKAREDETVVKGIYDRVYEAIRPEVFFKATSSRCVGPNEPICIRSDSKWMVPEPELAFILGRNREIVGYTIGNDVSARDIERENPLYLPQAKIFKGCCALGPAIATRETVKDPRNLKIRCTIQRNGEIVFESETTTSHIKRSLDELVEYICRDNPVPPGTAVLTGTGIIPPDDFTLKDRDIVSIEIENIGVLRNPVLQL
ncbi:MAG: fumarylacetoacetate hydrolase family protein [Candidatus Bathyarchaeia archaeon]